MENDREIHNTLNGLDFITFCEVIFKDTKIQERIYQADIEESQFYKLWQIT